MIVRIVDFNPIFAPAKAILKAGDIAGQDFIEAQRKKGIWKVIDIGGVGAFADFKSIVEAIAIRVCEIGICDNSTGSREFISIAQAFTIRVGEKRIGAEGFNLLPIIQGVAVGVREGRISPSALFLHISQIIAVAVIAARNSSERREVEELPVIVQTVIIRIVDDLDVEDFIVKCSRSIGRPDPNAQGRSAGQGTEITVDPQDVSGDLKKPVVSATLAFPKGISKSIIRRRVSRGESSNSRANRLSLGNAKTGKLEVIGSIGCNRRTNLQSVNEDIMGRTRISDRDNSFQGHCSCTISDNIESNDIVR